VVAALRKEKKYDIPTDWHPIKVSKKARLKAEAEERAEAEAREKKAEAAREVRLVGGRAVTCVYVCLARSSRPCA